MSASRAPAGGRARPRRARPAAAVRTEPAGTRSPRLSPSVTIRGTALELSSVLDGATENDRLVWGHPKKCAVEETG